MDPLSRPGRRPRIAVLDLSQPGWLAGASVTEVMVRSLAAVVDPDEFEVEFVATSHMAERCEAEQWGMKVVRLPPKRERRISPAGSIVGTWLALLDHPRVRNALGLTRSTDGALFAARRGAEIVFPLTNMFRIGRASGIGWIPDFQHLNLPDHFDPYERASRDRLIRQMAKSCALVMLSSDAVLADYQNFVPAHAGKGRVARFPSSLTFGEPMTPQPEAALSAYGIPRSFALVVNHFWKHKNHAVVVEAVATAAREGTSLPLVLVGTPDDYRDPRNENLSSLLQAIASRGVRDQVWLLGEVSREVLVALLRCAAVVIQPSRSEGWNTTVQDALALGRPVICSDLPVLREQAPDAVGFFDPDSAEGLARLLLATWSGFVPGPDEGTEARALSAQRKAADEYGRRLVAMWTEILGSPAGYAGASLTGKTG